MIRSEKNKIPTFETKAQQECYEVAIELHKRGLYYCPRDIGQSSAARALVSRGFLFRIDGVRHEESGNEVRGFGVVGLAYPDEAPITPCPAPSLDIAEARRLAREAQESAAKATPGPMDIHRFNNEGGSISWQIQQSNPPSTVICEIDDGDNPRAKEDAVFYAGAHRFVPALAALVQQMADEIDRLTAKLIDAYKHVDKLVNQRDNAREGAVRIGVGWSKAQDEIERIRADVAELQRDERAVLNQLKSSLRDPSHTGTTNPFADHAGRRVRRIMDGRTGIIASLGPDRVPHILLEGSGMNGFEGPALPADPAVWYLMSDIEPIIQSDLRGLAARESQPAMTRAPDCLCPAASEYDPPCPRHGILGIGVMGRP